MKNYGTHEKGNIEKRWRDWFRENPYDIGYQDKVLGALMEQLRKLKNPEHERFAVLYGEMKEERDENARRALAIIKSDCPIGFFKPSWEQAQVLNAWHPDFEPAETGECYRSICNFTCNRGGKTTGTIVINTGLWMIPNDPDWQMFQWMEDEEGQRHGNDRGRYRVELRPDWARWRRTGKLLIPTGGEPPMDACDACVGIENDNHWHDKVGKEFLKWMPKDWIARRPDGGTAIFKQERRIESRFGHRIFGKTYNSDIQDWAGFAVRIMAMDEGFPKRVFDEATLRIQDGGYFFWAYTAAEARNIGERAKLAYDCYKGKHRIVGRVKFFDAFPMSYIPDWIMPSEKKSDDMARLAQEGEIGRVRLGIVPFAATSPIVFGNFDHHRNVLPIDGPEVLLAIRGEIVTRWRDAFGVQRAESLQWAFDKANIVRGMDEGLANPTACVWTAILRSGEYVSFREWEESGLSVSERCRAIVERSGNTVKCLNPEAIEERRRYREERTHITGMLIRRTFADSKMFRRNPEQPSDDWTEVYARAGLRLERAGNIGPAARCDFANDMFRGEANRKHLISADIPGSRACVTRDCPKLIERFENYLWAQIATGQRMGEFTDKPESKDDHTLDAHGYVAISKLRWLDPLSTETGPAVKYDRQTGAVLR